MGAELNFLTTFYKYPFWEFMFASVSELTIVQCNLKRDSEPDMGG